MSTVGQQILCEGFDVSGAGAVVCSHVGEMGLPIRAALRDAAIDDADTGWQFHCNLHAHDAHGGQLWSVRQVVGLDPSVLEIIDSPIHSRYERSCPTEPWQSVSYGTDRT